MVISSKIIFNHQTFTFYKNYFSRPLNLKFLKKMSSCSVSKPPNVLVFSSEKVYDHVAKKLSKCLCADKYLIYCLKQDQVLTTPWVENAALLVVLSDNIEVNVAKKFIQYVEKGGTMLVVSSNFTIPGVCSYKITEEEIVSVNYKDVLHTDLYRGKYFFSSKSGHVLGQDDKNNAVIFSLNLGDGIMILSSIYLGLNLSDNTEASHSILKSLLTEKLYLNGYVSDLPKPTSGYVIVENDAQIDEMMARMSLTEISLDKSIKLPSEKEQSDVKVPLLYHYDDINPSLFDKAAYFSSLETCYFGRVVVFFPVVTSTMYPAERLSNHPGLVVIAKRQVAAKGRGENKWISPEGSAAFTLHFPLMLSSKLGQRMSLMQHMASLALVHGLRSRKGYEDLDFRLKWPNDIFFETDKKIGGVLVNTTIQGDVVHSYIGIGLNVANEHPTVCVNKVIKDYNTKHEKSLALLKIEEVIASTLNVLEDLANEAGISKFFDLYYKYWIHKDQIITIEASNQKATVIAIDEYGFLVVKTEDGKALSLQPDGNRFDIMKNLIVAKELKI